MRRALWLVLLAAACAGKPKHKETITFSSESFGPAWDDPGRCAAQVADGRLLEKAADRFRVVTWNLRWFPDGRSADQPGRDGGTDLPWLACTLAYMQADVVAVQEMKLNARAQEARQELQSELKRLTGAEWGWEQDSCADPDRQHLGFLYRTDRAQISHPQTDPTLDPTPPRRKEYDKVCPGILRPGLGVYVKSKLGGLDFHFLTLHLDSGVEERDYNNRQAAWQRLSKLIELRQSLVSDDDVVLAGDWNSMGCPSCEVADSVAERKLLADACLKTTPGLVLAETSAVCSIYYQGQGALVDHFVTSRGMREAYGAVQRVEGPCGRGHCGPLDPKGQQSMVRLSDHCPVYVDLLDQDADGALVGGR